MSWSTHIARIDQVDDDLKEECGENNLKEGTHKEEEATSIWCFGKGKGVVYDESRGWKLIMEGETLSQTL